MRRTRMFECSSTARPEDQPLPFPFALPVFHQGRFDSLPPKALTLHRPTPTHHSLARNAPPPDSSPSYPRPDAPRRPPSTASQLCGAHPAHARVLSIHSHTTLKRRCVAPLPAWIPVSSTGTPDTPLQPMTPSSERRRLCRAEGWRVRWPGENRETDREATRRLG